MRYLNKRKSTKEEQGCLLKFRERIIGKLYCMVTSNLHLHQYCKETHQDLSAMDECRVWHCEWPPLSNQQHGPIWCLNYFQVLATPIRHTQEFKSTPISEPQLLETKLIVHLRNTVLLCYFSMVAFKEHPNWMNNKSLKAAAADCQGKSCTYFNLTS